VQTTLRCLRNRFARVSRTVPGWREKGLREKSIDVSQAALNLRRWKKSLYSADLCDPRWTHLPECVARRNISAIPRRCTPRCCGEMNVNARSLADTGVRRAPPHSYSALRDSRKLKGPPNSTPKINPEKFKARCAERKTNRHAKLLSHSRRTSLGSVRFARRSRTYCLLIRRWGAGGKPSLGGEPENPVGWLLGPLSYPVPPP
jgi:hypothetical protein